MRPCIVLDTETTGFPNNGSGFVARIIEVGAVVVTADRRVVSPISFLVRQERAHLESWQARRAMQVHGITAEQVLAEGIPAESAAPRLARWVERVRERFAVEEVRAYNQGFDFWFLERSPWRLFDRTGLTPGEDIRETVRRGLQCARGPRLKTAVERINDLGGALHWQSRSHRATEDARMAAEVALHFAERATASDAG